MLAARARRTGARLRFGARVTSIAPEAAGGFRLGLAGGEELAARLVVGAWGRWDALDRSLDRAGSSRGGGGSSDGAATTAATRAASRDG